MNHTPLTVTPADIERYRARARVLQSRELARLGRRLVRLPARLSSAVSGAMRVGRVDPVMRARRT